MAAGSGILPGSSGATGGATAISHDFPPTDARHWVTLRCRVMMLNTSGSRPFKVIM
jgi:hypothetical protein